MGYTTSHLCIPSRPIKSAQDCLPIYYVLRRLFLENRRNQGSNHRAQDVLAAGEYLHVNELLKQARQDDVGELVCVFECACMKGSDGGLTILIEPLKLVKRWILLREGKRGHSRSHCEYLSHDKN